METEEDAKDTALDLRLKKRTFRGLPVKARIKTEPVVRSFYPVSAAVPPVYPIMPFAPMVPNAMGMDMMPYGFIPTIPDVSAVATTTATADAVEGGEAVVSSVEEGEGEGKGADDNKVIAGGVARPLIRGDGRRVPRSTTAPVAGGVAPRIGADGDVRKRPDRRVPTDRVSGVTNKDPKAAPVDVRSKPDHVVKPPIEVNAMTFPPLQGGEEADNTPIPTPGYKDVAYVKYSFDEIIAIVKNVKEASLPVDVKAADHPMALTTTPNLDLLKRQRTFSIDETREQLRQGRPVQREAIISGAVDMRSFVFGDDSKDHAAAAAGTAAPTAVASSSGASATETLAAAVSSSSAASTTQATEEVAAVASESVPVVEPVAAPVATPSKKISSSTWAAMVKSSAAALSNNAVDFPAPVTSSVPAVPRSATKAKAAANKTTPSETTTKPNNKNNNTPSKSNPNKANNNTTPHKASQKQQQDGAKKDQQNETEQNVVSSDEIALNERR